VVKQIAATAIEELMSEHPNSQPEPNADANASAQPAQQPGQVAPQPATAAQPAPQVSSAMPQTPQAAPAGAEFWTTESAQQPAQYRAPQPPAQYQPPQPYNTAQYPPVQQGGNSHGAQWGQPSYWTPPNAGGSDQPIYGGEPYANPQHGQAYGNQAYGAPGYTGQPYGDAYSQQQYSQAYAQQYGQGYGSVPPPPPNYDAPANSSNHPWRRKGVMGGVGAAMVLALAVGVVSYSAGVAHHDRSSATSFTTPNNNANGSTSGGSSSGSGGAGTNPFGGSGSETDPFGGLGGGSSSQGGTGSDGSGSSGSGGYGWSNPFGGGSSSGSGSGSSSDSGAKASSTQSVGVVDIDTVLDFGSGKAAGTGMVLTSDGEILTNNHVVEGSTSIQVTVISTGKTYTATVVGTDATDDVAVIKLQNASGLTTANIGDSSGVKAGDNVTAVGNAGGVGGTPSAAAGQVTALDQSITASDDDGSNSEHLTGMFQINADIQPGDSGGPLYDANNKIIGIDTAASSDSSSQTVGFAIPIDKALGIAKQIETGKETSSIQIGYPAFLGVQLSTDSQISTNGVPVAGVVDNSAAAKAGIQQGDTITAIDGTALSSDTSLSGALSKHDAGDQVKVTWTDSSGQSHTSTVTLGQGPAA
jgi:S1-C subfamily serine protease